MLLDKNNCEKVAKIKKLVLVMIQERNETNGSGDILRPSDYWNLSCDKFQYLLGLSEEYFGQLRLHTYHLDGDNYQNYFFKKNLSRDQRFWESMVQGLPKDYIISAPAILGEPGYNFNGHVVSAGTLSCQHAIKTLLQNGIINKLSNSNSPAILEIGGGYGAMAHHLGGIINHSKYFVVDLPETLLYSATYLSYLYPEKVYVYEKSSFASMLAKKFEGYKYVLLPNFVLDRLSSFQFSLVLNMQSFQEMRPNQLDAYLQFIYGHLDGVLYSWNKDVQPQNEEGVNVTKQLSNKFELLEIRPPVPGYSGLDRLLDMSLRRFINKFRKVITNAPVAPLREYVCTKKV